MQGDRLNDDDWKFITDYWTSPESEARTEIAKNNRAKLGIHHTSGSKSFACKRHEMGNELGRPVRRDELYITTHTRKNGVPSRNAEPIINKLKSVVETQPELTQRTIQEGDVFAAACGKKEPKGCVRGLGLGPTPQSVGILGVKCYTPTRVQMQILASQKTTSCLEAKDRRIAQLEAELAQERMANQRSNVENISQNGSNSRHHVSPRCEEEDGETNHVEFHEDDAYADQSNEYEYMLVPRTNLPTPVQQSCRSSPIPRHIHATPPVQQPPLSNPTPNLIPAAPPLRQPTRSSAIPSLLPATAPAQQPPARNVDAHHVSHDDLIGKEVILYAVLRADQPVAKGVIISSNPSTVLAGQALGKQYCEVVIRVVLKRDAKLPRPYAGVQEMADAKDLSIAWPYSRLKVSKVSKPSLDAGGRK